jgi:hypothetical protein
LHFPVLGPVILKQPDVDSHRRVVITESVRQLLKLSSSSCWCPPAGAAAERTGWHRLFWVSFRLAMSWCTLPDQVEERASGELGHPPRSNDALPMGSSSSVEKPVAALSGELHGPTAVRRGGALTAIGPVLA